MSCLFIHLQEDEMYDSSNCVQFGRRDPLMFETRETVWHLAHLVDNYVVAVEEEHFDKAEIKGLEGEIVAGRCQRGLDTSPGWYNLPLKPFPFACTPFTTLN